MPQETPNVNINFSKPQKGLVISDKFDEKIVKITGLGMIVFIIVMIAVIVLNFSIVSNHEKVKKNIATTQQQLNNLSKEELRYLQFVEKVKLLAGISEDRKIRKEALDFLNTLVPDEDVLKQVNLDQQEKTITFAVQTPDVFAFSRLLTQITTVDLKDKKFILQTRDVLRSPEGSYTLSAQLLFDLTTATPSNAAAKGATDNAN